MSELSIEQNVIFQDIVQQLSDTLLSTECCLRVWDFWSDTYIKVKESMYFAIHVLALKLVTPTKRQTSRVPGG